MSPCTIACVAMIPLMVGTIFRLRSTVLLLRHHLERSGVISRSILLARSEHIANCMVLIKPFHLKHTSKTEKPRISKNYPSQVWFLYLRTWFSFFLLILIWPFSGRSNRVVSTQNPKRMGVAWQKNYLVGGLGHFLFFLLLGVIIPTDFHIFQRGGSTTNQWSFAKKNWSWKRQPPSDVDSSSLRWTSLVQGLQLLGWTGWIWKCGQSAREIWDFWHITILQI